MLILINIIFEFQFYICFNIINFFVKSFAILISKKFNFLYIFFK